MTPTPRLRFVERETKDPNAPRTIRVLQQWFDWDVKYPTELGEWRDVPLEKEHG